MTSGGVSERDAVSCNGSVHTQRECTKPTGVASALASSTLATRRVSTKRASACTSSTLSINCAQWSCTIGRTLSKPSVAMVAWANELQLGAWFTLDHSRRVTRVQFAWRSDRRHLNLFASADGHSYLIQAGRLAAYLQAGLLLPEEEETLTVRATRDALAKLEANPERLLG